MKKHFSLFTIVIILLFKTTSGYSQNLIDLLGKESDTLIIWTKNRKLTWHDFKSEKKIVNFGSAQSGLSIMLEAYSFSDGIYSYKFFAGFYKNRSWSDSVNNNGFILKHEQIHFDIAEIFARKMRKEICKRKLDNKILSFADYESVHKIYYNQYVKYQDRYELETNHARIYKMQIKWEEKVKNELAELKKFNLKDGTE